MILDKIVEIDDKYEQFMRDKIAHDEIIIKRLDELTTNYSNR